MHYICHFYPGDKRAPIAFTSLLLLLLASCLVVYLLQASKACHSNAALLPVYNAFLKVSSIWGKDADNLSDALN
jgi:hypothetical protein